MLIFFLGSSGLFGYRELEFHQEKLTENLDELRAINTDLAKERDSLLYDASEVELRARTLGYQREDEIRIKIPGSAKRDFYRTLGALIRRSARYPQNYDVFRLIALCGAGILYIGLSLAMRVRSGYRKG